MIKDIIKTFGQWVYDEILPYVFIVVFTIVFGTLAYILLGVIY